MVVSKTLAARYKELKQQQPDCVLLMQVGAFFQVMNEDARQAGEITGIKLQMAGEVDNPMVLGGIPKVGWISTSGSCCGLVKLWLLPLRMNPNNVISPEEFSQTPFALFWETGISQHTLIGRQLAFRSLPSKPSTTLGVINV